MPAPFLLRTTEQAYAVGNTLLLPSPSAYSAVSPQARANAKPIAIERTLFALCIPHLPDFLTSPHLTGTNERERIAEVLERQTRFIANLGKWKGMGFALRYRSIPERGSIEIAFVVRGLARAGLGQQLGEQMAGDVIASLQANDLPIEPVADAQMLRETLQPFVSPTLFEIRQRETVVPLRLGDAYVVYSFRPALSTWIPSFTTLLNQRAPCVINIYLEPTRLFEYEHQSFSEAAGVAESLADFQFDGLAYRGRIADPQARIVARLYSNYLQRLTEPFLLVAQVASPDPITARAVAQTLGAEMTETIEFASATSDNAPLPSGFDVVAPRNAEEFQAAWRTMSALDLQTWGVSEATEGKERLRYLVDARGASAAFRFPIAVRGGVPGVKTRQIAPHYEMGERRTSAESDEIELGKLHGGGVATIRLNDLTQHGLIVGYTGMGKTNTCLSILAQLWRDRLIPFMVIEPSKSEYRGLIKQRGFEDLFVFTLGNETVSPFRLNPFELLPGVRLETHISALKTCFDAALPQFGILPALIEESIHAIYAEKGWQLTDKGSDAPDNIFPTLRDIHSALIKAAENYAGEVKQNLQNAASKRIGSLLRGSKGRMFNTQRSIPFDWLMKRPVVLEMDSLNADEQALVMMFVLTFVREYCKTRRGKGLQHVTLVEEAHLVMSNTAPVANLEVAANTQAEGAQAFARMLAEIRAYGEGMLIAEQSPSKLVRDAVANTNLKIAHGLQHQQEREAIASAMMTDKHQAEHLGRLTRGHAFIFMSGYEKATLMTANPFKDETNFDDQLSDDDVQAHMRDFHAEQRAVFLPFDGCRFCQRQCHYRERVEPVAYGLQAGQNFQKALWASANRRREGDEAGAWTELDKACREGLQPTGLQADSHAVYCYFVHLWAHKASEFTAQQLRQVAQKE